MWHDNNMIKQQHITTWNIRIQHDVMTLVLPLTSHCNNTIPDHYIAVLLYNIMLLSTCLANITAINSEGYHNI